jgi:O-antigen/teichoic acid export membrane protein
LIREFPRQQGQEAALLTTALLMVGAVGGCIGLLFAFTVPLLSADLHPLGASVQSVALFAIGVSLATVNLVLDQALIGLLRGDLQLWRNILFAGAKLAALTAAGLWLFQRGGLTIYATWALGDAFSLAALAGFAVLKGKWTVRKTFPLLGLVRKLGPLSLQHHLLNLLLIGPNLTLPVLVTVLISATMNAWFYVAFLLADVVYVIPQALVTALYAVSSARPDVLVRKARLTLGLAVITTVFANLILLFGSRQLLGLFGPGYAEQGVWSLRLLGMGAIPFLIKDHYIAICRIQDRIAKALLPLAGGALLELGIAVLGARLGGISGLSLGWVIAVCIEALLMSGRVYKTIRPTSTPTDQEQRQAYHLYHDEASAIERKQTPQSAI